MDSDRRTHPNQLTPPEPTLGYIELPDTCLHYAASGHGPPLIIVPATVSLIKQWLPLVQFMGLRYRVYFFELPGHGGSSPYPTNFSSTLVPKTVEHLVNHLGFTSFNLMGFSFGGLLALRTLEYLQDRIEKMILMAPLVSYRALRYSPQKQWLLKKAASLFKHPQAQKAAIQIMHSDSLHYPLVHALSFFSNIDRAILESKNSLNFPQTTLDVLSHTLDEILVSEFQPPKPFSTPCYFGMSVNDDLIQYDLTEQVIKQHFQNLTVQKFYHPYHQPPEPPTFDWLMDEFYPFINMID